MIIRIGKRLSSSYSGDDGQIVLVDSVLRHKSPRWGSNEKDVSVTEVTRVFSLAGLDGWWRNRLHGREVQVITREDVLLVEEFALWSGSHVTPYRQEFLDWFHHWVVHCSRRWPDQCAIYIR